MLSSFLLLHSSGRGLSRVNVIPGFWRMEVAQVEIRQQLSDAQMEDPGQRAKML